MREGSAVEHGPARGPWERGRRPGLPVGLDCSKRRPWCLLRGQAAPARAEVFEPPPMGEALLLHMGR